MTTSPPTSGKRFIGDLIEIPEDVHDGDLVFKVAEGVGGVDEEKQAQAIRDYVVTHQLARNFDEALSIIKGALAKGQSRATYLNGSFGSGKSHFMAVLHAILSHDPTVRGLNRMPTVLAKHDDWLEGRKFLLVTSHLVDAESIEAAILGGYVRTVRRAHPDAPVPPVYRADGLLADARALRATLGDEKFIADLPATGSSPASSQWGGTRWAAAAKWTPEQLDAAFAVPAGTTDRERAKLRSGLISALLSSHFSRYADVVHGDREAFVTLDEGLSVISRHAREQLGYDAVVLLLDELILRFTGFLGDEARINAEAQKMSKLVESSESYRPAPVISFVPRQRDLRDLVGTDVTGATGGLFDTLKYWDGRFDHIKLEDSNLTEVVRHRLLRPASPDAAAEISAAFDRMVNARPEVRDTLLDSPGGEADTWEDFRALYPFSPALLHVMVDLSAALQRQRSALKLMRKLLVNHRTSLPVGQLVPIGAVFDVLVEGEDRPFKDRLSAEYEKIRDFYRNKVRPWLLSRHRLTEETAADLDVRNPFRAEDLLVKTMLLAALVPNVPALKEITVSRMIALNHGIIPARRTGQDVVRAAAFFRELSTQFGEVRVGPGDNPPVSLNLLRVDTESLLRSSYNAANDQAMRRLFKRLVWEELGLDPDATRTEIIWRGTSRTVELDFGNVRSEDSLMRQRFQPETPGAVRVVIDYPFDEANHTPAEDRRRIQQLRDEFPEPPATLAWIPHFLSDNRQQDARRLLMMEHLLQPDVIGQKAPDWSSEDRREARQQLESQANQIEQQLRGLLRGAYGATNRNDTDYGESAQQHVEALLPNVDIVIEAGSQLGDALHRIAGKLLDHLYPEHPDFSAATGARKPVGPKDLTAVLRAVEQAKADRLQRYEPEAKSELPVLRRVAQPLEIATVSEVFILRDTWLTALDDAARAHQADTTDIRVRDLKKWIRDRGEGKGLPDNVVDLLVLVYAVQSDRAWMRAGKRYTDVDFGRLDGDIVLRRQPLPSEEDFDVANRRARELFGLSPQPVRNARAVQRLAEQLKERGNAWYAATEELLSQLGERTALLALDEEAPRLRTANATYGLLGRMRGLADDTELVTALARADLPGEAPVHRISMETAHNVAAALASARWETFETLNDLADGGGEHAAEAGDLLHRLQTAARHNEQEKKLATELDRVSSKAFALIRRSVTGDRKDPPPAVHKPDPGRNREDEITDPHVPDGRKATTTLSPGEDVTAAVTGLRRRLGIPADARIEITVRAVDR
ncbi:phage resistance protein [Thermobifida halotolerans]|uniref:Phage resistance protein n=1 Tax=Thermobifida halotolerans TaxID=483545 RepID=A0A399G4M7_9ACTN|nr:phage resistance protein [Thermobifida halotolerans]UOE19788.1 phage resistance protein [Thermobifida halotolerans]